MKQPRARAGATSPDGFYGNRILGYSMIALALTAPGQTAGVSAFVDPMIQELGISRSALSTAYMIGTLIGAAALPSVGRALDKHGVRKTMAVVGLVFGAALMALSLVSGLVGLTAAFAGIRLAGQGSLSLIATTAVSIWFARRRGFALGLVGAVGASGISLAPVALERLIHFTDWRTAWAIEAVIVWAVVIPVAWWGMRDRPSDLGQHPDGATGQAAADTQAASWGMTRAEAVRVPFFWVLTAASFTAGFLGTAIAFHQLSLLGEHGLSSTAAAGNFLPQTIAATAATFGMGFFVDRFSTRWLIIASMSVMAVALVWGTMLTPGWSAIGFGMLFGGAGGALRTLDNASYPRHFGTEHLGSIRGIVTALMIGGTAFAPLGFALIHDVTGSFSEALLLTLALPVGVAVAALFVRPPTLTATQGAA